MVEVIALFKPVHLSVLRLLHHLLTDRTLLEAGHSASNFDNSVKGVIRFRGLLNVDYLEECFLINDSLVFLVSPPIGVDFEYYGVVVTLI